MWSPCEKKVGKREKVRKGKRKEREKEKGNLIDRKSFVLSICLISHSFWENKYRFD